MGLMQKAASVAAPTGRLLRRAGARVNPPHCDNDQHRSATEKHLELVFLDQGWPGAAILFVSFINKFKITDPARSFKNFATEPWASR